MSYSLGKKKKRHTLVKNQILVNNHDYILHNVAHKKGHRHDYNTIYKKNHPVISKEFVTVVDLRYFGIDNDFPEQLSVLPCKKKRNLVYSRRKRV